MKPFFANFDTTSKVTINGIEYTGDSISIDDSGNTIRVNGVTESVINIRQLPKLDIIIHGDVSELQMSQGDLQCHDVHGDAKTSQGDIDCNNVSGNVKSSQGNISANNVGGNVKTSMGNIKYRQ